MASPWEIGTAVGTIGATFAAAWAVLDSKRARAQDLMSRVTNVVYAPIWKETSRILPDLLADPKAVVAEWERIKEAAPELAQRADPRIVAILSDLADLYAAEPGLDRRAREAATQAQIQAASKVDSAFSESRYIQLELWCEDGNLGLLHLREAWASRRSLEELWRMTAAKQAYDVPSWRFTNDKGRLCDDRQMTQAMFDHGRDLFQASPAGAAFTSTRSRAREMVQGLHRRLQAKIEPRRGWWRSRAL